MISLVRLLIHTQGKVNIAVMWWKNILKKNLWWLKKTKTTKRWICGSDYISNDVKVRNHCYITGKYRGSAHRDHKINLKINHKIPVLFQNSKNYDSHVLI